MCAPDIIGNTANYNIRFLLGRKKGWKPLFGYVIVIQNVTRELDIEHRVLLLSCQLVDCEKAWRPFRLL